MICDTTAAPDTVGQSYSMCVIMRVDTHGQRQTERRKRQRRIKNDGGNSTITNTRQSLRRCMTSALCFTAGAAATAVMSSAPCALGFTHPPPLKRHGVPTLGKSSYHICDTSRANDGWSICMVAAAAREGRDGGASRRTGEGSAHNKPPSLPQVCSALGHVCIIQVGAGTES